MQTRTRVRAVASPLFLLLAFGGAGCAGTAASRAAGPGDPGAAPAGDPAAAAIARAEVGGAIGASIEGYMDRQAAELRRDLIDAAVARLGEGIKITYDADWIFAMNEAELGPPAREELDVLAGILRKYHDTRVVVAVHTDSTGPDAYNRDLTRRRAEAISAYLASQGIPSARLTAVGAGEEDPVADNGTPRGRRKNRRVDIAVTADDELKELAMERSSRS